MKDDAIALLDRLSTVYGMPYGTDEATMPKFLAEYIRVLAGFDAKTLRKTGDHLLRTAKFWPKPSEIVDLAEGYLVPANTAADDCPAKRAIRAEREIVERATREYLTSCPSTLIDMALRQGWSRSLEDVARDVIRGCYRRDGALPSVTMMMRFRLPQVDVDGYARNGQSHLKADLDAILAARAQTGASDGVISDLTKRMTGEKIE